MTTQLTVIGGGLGGLVAAIAAQEAGLQATVHESGPDLGGRARTTVGEYRANWGPHALYTDGPLWAWLAQRGLHQPAHKPALMPAMRFRVDGRSRRLPPRSAATTLLKMHRRSAPVDQSYLSWATEQFGEPAAQRLASLAGVFTFDHDPGRLSARFVHERMVRVVRVPAPVRYTAGGWATMVTRLADHARGLGVTIHTSSRVEQLPDGPTVVAMKLTDAARLLGGPSLLAEGTTTALLDVGVVARRRDPFIVSDLDQCGWAERFSDVDPTLAPDGHQLIQSQIGMRPGESLADAVDRLEDLLDVGFVGWRERETWRRRGRVEGESGALDLPGTTWHDRPAVDRGDDVYLVGDMVAAPGLLSEVSFNSAVAAVDLLRAHHRTSTSVSFGGLPAR
jgi:phytoene dehydrogenase-like protein